MDREYMLQRVRERLKVLKSRYLIYVQGKNLDGSILIPSTASLKRAETKRDMQILMLLEALLEQLPNVFIDNQDAIAGFERITAPRERNKK